ncbi:uracil phosphoribosyltransferase-domain-containing protein [Xylaria sp. FL0064]|nr:uracil phosphoribosyltransferase-domain-containing protein [Xylaria sp. FL0064]
MPGSEDSVSSTASNVPVIVGVYGIPGCGKTFLLHQLEQELEREHFEFYEGSRMIASLVPGGLDGFHKMTKRDKVGVVTGHFMFWVEGEETGEFVYTLWDLDVYTHILYLDVAAELIAQRRRDDTHRTRPPTSINHLRKWQDTEKTELRRLCRDHGILFGLLSVQRTLVHKASAFLRDFRLHTEAYNLLCAERKLDEILGADKTLQTMLVFDADRTLAPEDTGELFWATGPSGDTRSLKGLFSGPLGYSYTAFRQAALLYEETAEESDFDALCTIVASAVHVHPGFLALLRLVAEHDHVGALVVTCGLRAVWEKVLEAEGLSKSAKVIGGGRIADGLVVTDTVKAGVVSRARDVHHLYVVAFGDSPLDLPMLTAADQAIVVVGEENSRSKTMDAALHRAMERDGLRPSQALLPSHAGPRLDVVDLPVISIDDPEFTNSIFSCRHRPSIPSSLVLHATGRNVAKLLMTPTRDADMNGPNLREAHRRIGWYLAAEFLTGLVGLEEYAIPHVQGHQTSGFRLRGVQLTSIIALMRGGEPMAFGVSDALPEAMFIHAKDPKDILLQHLDGRHTVILVDSVVNSGKSVVQFVQHIRIICSKIRIVVIAGVVQAQSVTDGGLAHMLAHDTSLHLIALRLSDNKFTGQGTTDTGNRLFNSTCLC